MGGEGAKVEGGVTMRDENGRVASGSPLGQLMLQRTWRKAVSSVWNMLEVPVGHSRSSILRVGASGSPGDVDLASVH